jgi:hypothetical protein
LITASNRIKGMPVFADIPVETKIETLTHHAAKQQPEGGPLPLAQ